MGVQKSKKDEANDFKNNITEQRRKLISEQPKK